MKAPDLPKLHIKDNTVRPLQKSIMSTKLKAWLLSHHRLYRSKNHVTKLAE